MRLVEILRQFGALPLTAVRLMGLLQMLREADGGYTPVMKKGRKEAQWAAETARRYGQDVGEALQQYAEDEFDYFGRCKRAALLLDWIAGTPVETLEQRYSTNPYQGKIGHGDIRRFADLTRMNLRSAHQIAAIMFVGSEPSEEEIEHLLRQLEVGIPSDGLALLELPVAPRTGRVSRTGAGGDLLGSRPVGVPYRPNCRHPGKAACGGSGRTPSRPGKSVVDAVTLSADARVREIIVQDPNADIVRHFREAGLRVLKCGLARDPRPETHPRHRTRRLPRVRPHRVPASQSPIRPKRISPSPSCSRRNTKHVPTAARKRAAPPTIDSSSMLGIL